MSSKKIALVIPSLNAGGMERVMSELANYFASKSELEVFLIVYTKGQIFFELNQNIKLIMPDFVFRKKRKIWYTIKTLIFLRRAIIKIKPYSVLSFGETYNSFVLLSTLFLKTNVFVSDRSKPDKSWGIFHESLRRMLYPKASGIIAQTSYAKSFISKETSHSNIEIIPNPVLHGTQFNPLNNKVILSVGRLIKTKKIDILIKIFSELDNNDWNLWIVGDGPDRKTLEKISKELGIYNKVTFWGNQKDIQSFYYQGAIFAFTSVSEGFPNAILEAMSAGLPCIAFDCIAGPSDLIQDGFSGFLIPEMDEISYRKKLTLLMNENKTRSKMGKNAHAISLNYSIEKVGNSYINFLLK